VTLRFLGWVDEEEERHRLDSAWAGVALPAPFEAVLGPATARLGPAILHVPVGGLDELASSIVRATADVGEPPDDRPFRGHLTLARARRRGVDLRPYAGQPLAARWSVTEVTLVQSHTSPRGSRYEVMARRALRS
jgi:2'-5' RNA ligase